MERFECLTCSSLFDENDIGKHLSSTRHKNVKYCPLDEVIECEQCEDNNIHQISVVRFGLSDMALMCQMCLNKEEKPSTQYSNSNGSLFKKIRQYYQFRDIECQGCGSDVNLFVSNEKGKGQQVFCGKCLQGLEGATSKFVSERDDNFLFELLHIKEFVPPKNSKSNGKGRTRKSGKKGGKKGKGGVTRAPKKVDPNADERRAHYNNMKASASAIKAGSTVLAVGADNPKAVKHQGSKKSGNSNSGTENRRNTGKGSSDRKPKDRDQRPQKKNDFKSSPQVSKKGNKEESAHHQQKTPRDRTEIQKSEKMAPKKHTVKKPSDDRKGDPKVQRMNQNEPYSNGKLKSNDKVKNGNGTKKAGENGKKDHRRDNKMKSEAKLLAEKSNTTPSKQVQKKEDKNRDSRMSGGKDSFKPDRHSDPLPPGIKNYTPSPTAKLQHESLTSYCMELSYNLFMEEKITNESGSNLYIGHDEMSIEWYSDQDKKHKQYKVSILLTPEFLNRFVSKKMQAIKRTPLSMNQAIFLVLGDDIPWYGEISTVDTRSLQRGRKNGPQVMDFVVSLFDWNYQNLPLSANIKNLRLLPASVPVSRVFTAMSRIENPRFISMLMGKEPIRQIFFRNYLKFTRDSLNESQKVAIQSVMNNSITVLQGPPGTGKTSTIYEIILQLLENLNTYPILVVAASNIAIDNLAEKFSEKHANSILRIVSKEKESEYNKSHPLSRVCLHHKVYDSLPLSMKETIQNMRNPTAPAVSQNQFKKLLTEQIRISDTLIAQARVIFTTTVVAGGNQLKPIKKLPVIIMDEATQSSEATTLIPLSMQGVEKFVFVGDHKQLSSYSQVPSLSLSLFERVLLNGCYKTPHMLDTQYRMHPAISEFSRHRFYDDKLKDGISEKDRQYPEIPANPVYFWDTNREVPESRVKIRFSEDRGFTYQNSGEVNLIIDVLIKLIYEKQIKRSDIGVITPYRGQRDLISSILEKNDMVNPTKEKMHIEIDRDDFFNESKPITIHTVSDIMVASIDAFQGREKKFIVMSCVRSNSENSIGFLGDERRLNVALTRAQYGLILIGDYKCLSEGNELWKEFLTHLTTKGSVNQSKSFLY